MILNFNNKIITSTMFAFETSMLNYLNYGEKCVYDSSFSSTYVEMR